MLSTEKYIKQKILTLLSFQRQKFPSSVKHKTIYNKKKSCFDNLKLFKLSCVPQSK